MKTSASRVGDHITKTNAAAVAVLSWPNRVMAAICRPQLTASASTT